MPLLGDPDHAAITYSLQHRIPKILGLKTPSAPRAIVLVTAHWTTDKPTVSNGTSHDLLYDYGGFPPETYKIKYPAAGEPGVASQVAAAFTEQGLEPVLDPHRKWDHGVFVPMILVNPDADVPIVQVSVLEDEDADRHIKMGKALASLRKSNIAIVGSGFASLHHFGLFRQLHGSGETGRATIKAEVSDPWNLALTKALQDASAGSWDDLRDWRSLKNANSMHPVGGGEHFMPLVVCAGAGAGEPVKHYKDQFLGQDIYTYYWGADIVE